MVELITPEELRELLVSARVKYYLNKEHKELMKRLVKRAREEIDQLSNSEIKDIVAYALNYLVDVNEPLDEALKRKRR